MGLANELSAQVSAIFRNRWTTRNGYVVPEASAIQLGNDAVKLTGTVLYADIDGSTSMVDTKTAKFAAAVYKSYLHCAAKLIRSEGGVITAYDGDRIMAVFIGGSKNTSATRCGMKIKAAVAKVINPLIQQNFKTAFVLKQVVGIDTSELFIARTGIRGSNDLVWVGHAANHAAKLSGISEQPYATFISKAVYQAMHLSLKVSTRDIPMWESRSWNGQTIYRTKWFWNIPRH